MSLYPENGPDLRYTNEAAHKIEKDVSNILRAYNNDLYDLLKWAEELRQENQQLRERIVQLTKEEN